MTHDTCALFGDSKISEPDRSQGRPQPNTGVQEKEGEAWALLLWPSELRITNIKI